MTSFAKSISPSPIAAAPARDGFDSATTGPTPKTEARPSDMVAKDKPHPAPRPSPDIAGDVDRTAFNGSWEREQRAARKAAFIATRTDPETGGRVRVLNKTFNR